MQPNATRAAWNVSNYQNLTYQGQTQPFAKSGGANVMYGMKAVSIGGTVTVSGNTHLNCVDEALVNGTAHPPRTANMTIDSPTALGPFAPGVSLGAGIQFTTDKSVGAVTWTHSTPVGGQALPTGVTFSVGGLLAGTPGGATAGTYTHRFTATHSRSPLPQTAYVDLTFNVAADLVITTVTLPTFDSASRRTSPCRCRAAPRPTRGRSTRARCRPGSRSTPTGTCTGPAPPPRRAAPRTFKVTDSHTRRGHRHAGAHADVGRGQRLHAAGVRRGPNVGRARGAQRQPAPGRGDGARRAAEDHPLSDRLGHRQPAGERLELAERRRPGARRAERGHRGVSPTDLCPGVAGRLQHARCARHTTFANFKAKWADFCANAS